MELVNPVPVEEVEPWLAAVATTLLGSPWEPEFPKGVERWRRDWWPDRSWGVRDRGRWVATLATNPRMITIPGPPGTTVDLPADALTAVSVSATHRRQGLLRQMITRSLQATADRGDPVAILIAAEWPIYGRYGYAPATRETDYTFQPRLAGAGIARDPAGAVRQIEPDELGEHAAAIFAAARGRWAGQVDRPREWWARRLGLQGYEPMSAGRGTWIVHEGDDGPDGLLSWKVTRDFELTGDMGVVDVMEFATASDAAYRNLWAYLSALDLIGEVRLHGRPVDEPARWLLPDGRALRQQTAHDGVWVRLLDVPAALSARGYGTDGRLVIEVVDTDLGGYAAGRFVLDAGPDGASCTPTGESADLELSQRALSTVFLGDQSLRGLRLAGGIDELRPGALARADALFATPERPWNDTGF